MADFAMVVVAGVVALAGLMVAFVVVLGVGIFQRWAQVGSDRILRLEQILLRLEHEIATDEADGRQRDPRDVFGDLYDLRPEHFRDPTDGILPDKDLERDFVATPEGVGVDLTGTVDQIQPEEEGDIDVPTIMPDGSAWLHGEMVKGPVE